MSLAASESSLRRIVVLNRAGDIETVAKSAHRLNQVGIELPAQTPDEHFDRIGIPVEILVVKMFDKFGAGNDAAFVVREIGEETIFEGGEFYGVSVECDARGARVEAQ